MVTNFTLLDRSRLQPPASESVRPQILGHMPSHHEGEFSQAGGQSPSQNTQPQASQQAPSAQLSDSVQAMQLDSHQTPVQVNSPNAPTEIHAYPDAGEEVDKTLAMNQKRSKVTFEAMTASLNEILHVAETVFPFTFFPSRITVDRNQVVISIGVFFFTRSYISFLVEQIHHVIVRKGVLFSEIEFEVIGYEQNPPKVNYLYHRDAERIKQYIDAINLARASEIVVTELTKEEITEMAKKLTYKKNLEQMQTT